MKLLLRFPYRYLLAHWTLTGALAAALLLPHQMTGTRTAGATAHSITLLTGQVVQLNAGGTPQPSPDLREGQFYGPDEYAVPRNVDPSAVGEFATPQTGDALVPQTGGAIPYGGFFNAQLFDVSYLEANGYDNASTDRMPVIVQFASQQDAQQAVAHGLVDGGIHLTHAFEYVPDAMGYVSKSGPFVSPAPDYRDGIVSIYLDAMEQATPDTIVPAAQSGSAQDAVAPLLNEALPLIGADVARQHGLTGHGIKIAVVDTGIDGKHPDLAGRIVAAKDFSSDNNVSDGMGHGTHVAGIAAGTGAASDGKYGGVAPAAALINAKALSKNGSGSMSSIMRA
ncbi:MAG TPA: S8 family serine peptidase, partial [Chloroflexota bacterium]|nr:S8 family serine peptidase [Chloroflexota bacterium]